MCACWQGTAGLQSILPLTGYLFALICYRELLMDINDREGDAAAGVPTVPVCFGGMQALAVAAGCALSAAFAGVKGLHAAKALPSIAGALGLQAWQARTALQALLLIGMLPVLTDILSARRSKLDCNIVDKAIGNSFKPIAAGMLLLSLC